jgi:hypothetical protein
MDIRPGEAELIEVAFAPLTVYFDNANQKWAASKCSAYLDKSVGRQAVQSVLEAQSVNSTQEISSNLSKLLTTGHRSTVRPDMPSC